MLINIKDYLPRYIVPRKGPLKLLTFTEQGDKLILRANNCRKPVTINSFIEFDENSFVAIGLYLAEGNKKVSDSGKARHNGETVFTNSYLDSLKCFLELMNKFGLATNSFSWHVGLNINYYFGGFNEAISFWHTNLNLPMDKMRKPNLKGVVGGRLSKNTFEFGHVSLSYGSVLFRSVFLHFINLVFNEAIESKNKSILSLILKGYFAGDGHVSSGKNSLYFRRQVEFLCNDPLLFKRIYNALLILGLSNLKQTYPESTQTHTKAIRIYNRHDFIILNEYKIPNFVDYKSDIFNYLIQSYR